GRSVRRLIHDPLRMAHDPAALRALIYGWGNEGYSAQHEYLGAMIRTAGDLDAAGDILECGSGLSTIALAAVARRQGRTVTALEHIPEWATRVRAAICRAGLADTAMVVDAPLTERGEFAWYDFAGSGPYALVICDGPPAATHGGRYGLLPIMRTAFAPGCTILLDDLSRSDEQATLERWARESGGRAEIVVRDKPFGVLKLPATTAPRAEVLAGF
ncbi:MAG TPA: class I SAM-dependent methyltransferase, partial [Gemmatimonadaceae bacterium]|nr:class I SAM-dependent methyltransferase [Gemmatimonadaceae bacterium]